MRGQTRVIRRSKMLFNVVVRFVSRACNGHRTILEPIEWLSSGPLLVARCLGLHGMVWCLGGRRQLCIARPMGNNQRQQQQNRVKEAEAASNRREQSKNTRQICELLSSEAWLVTMRRPQLGSAECIHIHRAKVYLVGPAIRN